MKVLLRKGLHWKTRYFRKLLQMWTLSPDPTKPSLMLSDCVVQLWGGAIWSLNEFGPEGHPFETGFPNIVLGLRDWPLTDFTVSRPHNASGAVDETNFPWVSLVSFPFYVYKASTLIMVINVLHQKYWCVLNNVFHHTKK